MTAGTIGAKSAPWIYTGGLFASAAPLSLGRKHWPGDRPECTTVRHARWPYRGYKLQAPLVLLLFSTRLAVGYVGEIDSFVRSATGCSRIADKHLVYLTHRIILVIFRPPRCFPPHISTSYRGNILYGTCSAAKQILVRRNDGTLYCSELWLNYSIAMTFFNETYIYVILLYR